MYFKKSLKEKWVFNQQYKKYLLRLYKINLVGIYSFERTLMNKLANEITRYSIDTLDSN